MRTLTFEQISDSRFESNPIQKLFELEQGVMSALHALHGVRVFHDGFRKVSFEDPENNWQLRCRFYVCKETSKTTWNDIYKAVNSVKAVPYHFTTSIDWKDVAV